MALGGTCSQCQRPLIEIDHYGERLIGCINCNRYRPSAGLSTIGLAELAVVAEGAASDTVTSGLTYPFCCIHDT
jgi:hypothetical protein